MRSAPKPLFFAAVFFGSAVFFAFKVLPSVDPRSAVAINPGSDYNVHVDDSCATTLSLAFGSPPQLPHAAGAGDHIASVRMIDQINHKRLYPVKKLYRNAVQAADSI